MPFSWKIGTMYIEGSARLEAGNLEIGVGNPRVPTFDLYETLLSEAIVTIILRLHKQYKFFQQHRRLCLVCQQSI